MSTVSCLSDQVPTLEYIAHIVCGKWYPIFFIYRQYEEGATAGQTVSKHNSIVGGYEVGLMKGKEISQEVSFKFRGNIVGTWFLQAWICWRIHDYLSSKLVPSPKSKNPNPNRKIIIQNSRKDKFIWDESACSLFCHQVKNMAAKHTCLYTWELSPNMPWHRHTDLN